MDCHRHKIESCFRMYYGALCYFAEQYLRGDSKLVEDIVQDCFVRLLEHSPEFESDIHLRNHLYTSVRNSCINHLEHNRVVERHAKSLKDTDIELHVEQEIFSVEVVRQLSSHIASLPSQCRTIIEMSYVSGLDNQAIAESLGLSVNTIRAQKMRGKKLLKASMSKAAL